MTKQTQKAIKEKAEKFDKLAAELLPHFNGVKDILDRIENGDFDLRLSDMDKLQSFKCRLQYGFDYRPQKCEDGNHPNHWGDFVLPGDSRAYYYKGGE